MHVVDDVHVQTQLGEQIFKGDSLELLLDGDLRGDYADPKLSGDDFQLGLTPGEQKIGGPEAYLWYPKAKAGRPAAVTVAAYQDETGNGNFATADHTLCDRRGTIIRLPQDSATSTPACSTTRSTPAR